MYNNINNLEIFYASRLGRHCRRLINYQLNSFVSDVKGMNVLGIGYTFPFMNKLRSENNGFYVFSTNNYGNDNLTSTKNLFSCIIEENTIPIPDLYFDRIIISHTLEFLANIENFLQEVWRILNGEGRIIILVPNRLGLWARDENNPFGYGQPFSKSQIINLLKKNKFQITKIKYSLYIPPNYINLILKYSNNIDIFFSKFVFGFGGILIVEAKKEIYGFQSPQTSKNKKLTKLVTIPAKAMRVL